MIEKGFFSLFSGILCSFLQLQINGRLKRENFILGNNGGLHGLLFLFAEQKGILEYEQYCFFLEDFFLIFHSKMVKSSWFPRNFLIKNFFRFKKA